MNRPWSRRRRYSRALAYLLTACAGVIATVAPPPSVETTASPVYVAFYLWTVLLIVGGALSAVGAARGRWLGEYVGLWPLIVSFLAFGLATATNGRGWQSAAGSLLLTAFATWLYSRWLDVALLRRDAARSQVEQTGDADRRRARGDSR
jgi:hypothetical protein